jgi:glycosyltransferase involved in cell wall biosynthesis
MKGVLPIIKHYSGCDYHRIINPMKNLGFDIESIPKKTTEDLLKETKILFFNRSPENDFDKVLIYQKRYGFKIVLDLDDYWQLNVNHPLYSTWIENKMGENIVRWLKVATAVIVTTSRLADKVRQFNSNVHVIPNALPFGEGQFTDYKSESPFTRFIYTGGESHVWDVNLLRTAMSKVNNLSNAQFVLAGYSSKNPKVWMRMESVFKQAKNYERRDSQPLDSYMNLYNDADVTIVPLEGNVFTPYKSNIKFLEAGCKNMPVICSNTPPYSDEPVYLEGIRYAKNTREWLNWFKYYHDNPSARIENGLELGEYVRTNYDLTKINEYRIQLFNHLMS